MYTLLICICHLASWKMVLLIQCHCVKLACVSSVCVLKRGRQYACHDSQERHHKKASAKNNCREQEQRGEKKKRNLCERVRHTTNPDTT